MNETRSEKLVILMPDTALPGERAIALEAPVAIEVNGIGYAVMMMSPAALVEFATGFMLTERLADTSDDIIDIDPFETDRGWIVRVTLSERCSGRIADRVRHRSSDTGCGLCGIAGLDEVSRPVAAKPPQPRASRAALFAALAAIRDHQPLNRTTGALHAAAFCDGEGRIVRTFEDVGRHNALDKLIGALANENYAIASGFLLVTSRISFEMVDKALVSGAPMLLGISAPTAMAIDRARIHGLTLLALGRQDSILLLNDPHQTFMSSSVG